MQGLLKSKILNALACFNHVFKIKDFNSEALACLCKAQDYHPSGDHVNPKDYNQGHLKSSILTALARYSLQIKKLNQLCAAKRRILLFSNRRFADVPFTKDKKQLGFTE